MCSAHILVSAAAAEVLGVEAGVAEDVAAVAAVGSVEAGLVDAAVVAGLPPEAWVADAVGAHL